MPEPVAPVAPTPTPASEWPSPRKIGFPVVLPSGAVARVKRTMNILRLVKEGKIPNPLCSMLEEAFEKGQTAVPFNQMDSVAQGQIITFIEETVCEVMVDPKCVRPPEGADPDMWEPSEPNTITLSDLTWDDKFFIYQVAQGGLTDVETFRMRQAKIMESVSASEDLGLSPKPIARTKRAGSGGKRK